MRSLSSDDDYEEKAARNEHSLPVGVRACVRACVPRLRASIAAAATAMAVAAPPTSVLAAAIAVLLAAVAFGAQQWQRRRRRRRCSSYCSCSYPATHARAESDAAVAASNKYSFRCSSCAGFARPPPPPPPLLSGPIPFVRAGWRFATQPSPQRFIERARATHGDVFTVEMGARRMTYVFAADGVRHFFHASASAVNFVRAVEPFTHKIFGLAPHEFAAVLHPLLSTLRGELSGERLAVRMRVFRRALEREIDRVEASWRCGDAADDDDNGGASADGDGDGGDDGDDGGRGGHRVRRLFDVCARVMFRASLCTVFGERFACRLNGHDGGGGARLDALYHTFQQFDDWFELAASPVPLLFLPRFRAARRALFRAMRDGRALIDPDTPLARLLAMIDERLHTSVMLTLLWASASNTTWSAGWLVAYMAASGRMEGVANRAGDAAHGAIERERHTADDARAADSTVWDCVLETLRLVSSGMAVRLVTRPLRVDVGGDGGGGGGAYTVPAGDYLCISPYLLHRTGVEDGAAFRPERYADVHDKSSVFCGKQRALQTFGGGVYRCPGQLFALHELVAFGEAMQRRYRVTLGDGDGGAEATSAMPPPCDEYRLVGVKRPVRDIPAVLRARRVASRTGC